MITKFFIFLNESYKDNNPLVLKRNNKRFWIGTVNIHDGNIEEVHTFEHAKHYDFHHSFYFSPEQYEKIYNGDCIIFWDNGGGIENWENNLTPELIKKIKDQLK